jgi:hypothetical protein
VERTYLSLKRLVELLLVVGRDVLGVQLTEAIPYPAVDAHTTTEPCTRMIQLRNATETGGTETDFEFRMVIIINRPSVLLE